MLGEHVHHPVACLPCQSAILSEQEVLVILLCDKLLVRKTNQSGYMIMRHQLCFFPLFFCKICSSKMLNEILKSLHRAEKTEVLSEDLLQVSRGIGGLLVCQDPGALTHVCQGGCHETSC